MTGKYKRKIRRGIVLPLQQFINREKSAGVVLGISIVVALVLANSPWSEDYFHLFEHKLGFFFDGETYLYHSLHHWINDGLMSMFFFVVGLELKREFIGGELSDPRNTVLPIGAAVAGMLVPALIYTLLNGGTPAAGGWGIPMATDIAFSLAIIYLLGDRVPLAAKVFLTTLAIVDDLGAVVVIALFYTSEISLINLAVGVIILLVMWGANKMGVKNVLFYGLLGIGGVWVAFLMSGIHATIAAVLAAFVIPADARLSEANYLSRAARHLRRFGRMQPNGISTLAHEQLEVIARMKSDTRDAIPPSQRLEHAMHPFVSFVVMPIFALANAGVSFAGLDASLVFSTNVALGVALGLLLGKPLGILLSTWVLVRLGAAPLPEGLTWRRVVGLGFLASIGFTMSMFISTLAFTDDTMLLQAKLGIFGASILGGAIGYRLLKR
ncbi:MAG TPA: Na+/H+ antiporter NhaA [Candidatus Bacteroides pullicola]|uniref:Na(+)/H(+) antiporter NhaA n=1 Tax=Candidatus Bacteroides pullicola TaxID=2838475 RepID=A0A9D1ZJF9_9BACE|nr:Na+/H+ antiporter NhaA [Candidatus Bacteroides pullicola]